MLSYDRWLALKIAFALPTDRGADRVISPPT
jgi:hypothetical protein